MRARSILVFALAVGLAGCGSGPPWEKSISQTSQNLYALYGFAANDVWAAGASGVVLHYDGSAWTKVPSGTYDSLTSIWGSTPNDVWFAGDSGTVLRWNGTSLQPVESATRTSFSAVHGSSASAVFFCSYKGVFVYDGAFHELKPSSRSLNCDSLFARGPTEVGALVWGSAGKDLVTLTTTGATVFESDLPLASDLVVGVAPTDLWVIVDLYGKPVVRVGTHDRGELALPDSLPAPKAAWANGPNDVWLGGSNGYLAHFDGNAVTLIAEGEYDGPVIHALWGNSKVTWAAGEDGWLLHREQP